MDGPLEEAAVEVGGDGGPSEPVVEGELEADRGEVVGGHPAHLHGLACEQRLTAIRVQKLNRGIQCKPAVARIGHLRRLCVVHADEATRGINVGSFPAAGIRIGEEAGEGYPGLAAVGGVIDVELVARAARCPLDVVRSAAVDGFAAVGLDERDLLSVNEGRDAENRCAGQKKSPHGGVGSGFRPRKVAVNTLEAAKVLKRSLHLFALPQEN